MNRSFLILCTTLAALMIVGGAFAQIWPGNMWDGWRGGRPRYATATLRDGEFHFCRLMYQSAYREAGGSGWRTDYPGADINFSIRFAELTKAAVSKDHDGELEHFVVR